MAALNTEPARAAIIGKDDFDSPYIANIRIIQLPINTQSTTWDVVNRDMLMNPNLMDVSVSGTSNVAKNSSDSLGFIDSRKTDKFFGMHRSGSTRKLIYTFDVSNHVNLSLKMDWSTSGDVTDKDVKMTASLDGATPVTIFQIGSSINSWSETLENNTTYLRNRRAEVTVNGQPANFLTDNFQTYSSSIPGLGSTLTVEVVMNSTVAFGGFGLDNLELSGSTPGSYTAWAAAYGLSGANASKTADLDRDGYHNLLEYALGLNPLVINASSADRLAFSNGQASIRLPKPARADVFYQIMRSSNSKTGKLYVDWEIFASRWGTDPWVGDEPITDPTSGERTVAFTIPGMYADDEFKCVAIDTHVYPEHSWDYFPTFPTIRRPRATQNGGLFTIEDIDLIASAPISLGALREGYNPESGQYTYDQLTDVLEVNPLHKSISYLNGGIIYYSKDDPEDPIGSNKEDYFIHIGVDANGNPVYKVDETKEGKAQAIGYVDYRKQTLIDYQKTAISEFKAAGHHGMMIDAMGKTNGGIANIVGISEQKKAMIGYYDFLSHVRDTFEDGFRMPNVKPGRGLSLLIGPTLDSYETLEGLLNDYFNSLYAEGWYSIEKNTFRDVLDWYIQKWTRHGKLLIVSSVGVDPENGDSMMHLASMLVILGRHTYIRGNDENGYATSYLGGGWKNPDYVQHLSDKKLGPPLSDAVREPEGYVYTREFKYARVKLDVAQNSCRIEWLDDNGNTYLVWEKPPVISPDAEIIAADDFDDNHYGLTREITNPANSLARVWGISDRKNITNQSILDTSLYNSNGSNGDANDKIGFLKSNKTDKFFGISFLDEADGKKLIYTVNISGYKKMAMTMDFAIAGQNNRLRGHATARIDGGEALSIFETARNPNYSPIYLMEDDREISNDVGMSYKSYDGTGGTGILYNDFDQNSVFLSIPGEGQQLTIEFTFFTPKEEAAGIDNLKIYGIKQSPTEIPAPVGLSGPDADSDRDGQNDAYEIAFGSDPLSSTSKFSVNLIKGATGVSANFLSHVSKTYFVEWSSDLTNWTVIATKIGDGQDVRVDLPTSSSSSFVRIRAQ
jgi:hypothetical protein